MPVPSDPTRTRALVLGGGGTAGIAWESGLLTGLIEAGVDLGAADLVVGTSAGSVVAAMLRSGRLTMAGLAAAGMPTGDTPDATHPGQGAAVDSGEAAAFDGTRYQTATQQAAAGATTDEQARARLGALARRVTVSMPQDAWVARMTDRLPAQWPQGRLGVTAVDAVDGTFRVFDAGSGVDLPRAVAASCTVPTVFPLVEIDGRPHMDGGMRSSTNADVAAGHDAVLVVSCGPEAPSSPYGPTLDQSLTRLRQDGEVLLVTADGAAQRAFGGNVLDPATQAPSFAAGRAQAAAVADEVRAFWG